MSDPFDAIPVRTAPRRSVHKDQAMLSQLLQKFVPPALVPGALVMRHIPLVVLAYSCLLPRELSIEVMDASLFPYRLAAIVLAPFSLVMIMREPLRPMLLDFVALFAATWVPIALFFTTSLEASLGFGASFTVDLLGAYIIGRSAIRSPQDLRTLFLAFMPGLFVLLSVLAAESVLHRNLLRPYTAALLGLPMPEIGMTFRMGLMRAIGPFPHPILAGVFAASMLPFAWYLSHNNWQRFAGIGIAMGAVFSASSAAILALALAAGFILLDIVQKLTRLPVFLLVSLYVGIMGGGIALLSERGLLSFVINRLTFDPSTGFYRLMIWQYGSAEAMAHPWTGIGQRDWVRPSGMVSDSIDAYWLLLAMHYGFPALIAALVLVAGAIVSVLMSQRWRHPADRNCGLAMIVFLLIVLMTGLTVHFWENLNAWIFAIVGGAVSLAGEARRVPAPRHGAVPGGLLAWLRAGLRSPGTA